jgi:hypothetical protein
MEGACTKNFRKMYTSLKLFIDIYNVSDSLVTKDTAFFVYKRHRIPLF